MAQWLLVPAAKEETAARQQAIQELRPRLDLREELAVLGDGVRSNLDPDVRGCVGRSSCRFRFPRERERRRCWFPLPWSYLLGCYMAAVWTRTPLLIALLVELACWLVPRSRRLAT